MDFLYEELKAQVSIVMQQHGSSGHGFDHIDRVVGLALEFTAEISEYVNSETVLLIAMLHDVDDKKLFGSHNEEHSINARKIMNNLEISQEIQENVCSEIKKLSFRSALKGNTPETIEGKIVSDADKCDAMGAGGLLRAYDYNFSELGSKIVFDWDIKPIAKISYEEYGTAPTHPTDTLINHYFEKILHLPKYMLTEPGKEEANLRNLFDLDFVYHFLRENHAPEEFYDLMKQI